MDEELEKQMKMLEGLNFDNIPTTPVQPQPGVETAETLRGEVPFIPDTPENPTNRNIITNSIMNENPAQLMANANVVQPTVTQPIQPQPVPQSVINNIKVNQTPQSNDIMNDAPVFVNLSSTGFQTKTDFLKLKEGEKTRVTLVNMKFVREHIHYIDGLGTIKCLSKFDDTTGMLLEKKICCMFPKKDGSGEERAKNRLLVPVIEYPVSKADGKTIIQGTQPKLKMWNMNIMEERALAEVLESYRTVSDDPTTTDLTSFDLTLSKVKTNDFPTISLVPVPSWRKNFPIIDTLANDVTKEFYETAHKEVARYVSEDRVKAIYDTKQQEVAYANQIANNPIPGVNGVSLI